MAQQRCAKQDWLSAEFSDGSKLQVQERRGGTLRYELVSGSGAVQEMQVRDGLIIEWSRTGRTVRRFYWVGAPARFSPLKPGMTFTATARTDLPDGRPQLLKSTFTVDAMKTVTVGECSYPTYRVVALNVIDEGMIVQKVVRYLHEKSGFTLRTEIYAVAGGEEREISRSEATVLR